MSKKVIETSRNDGTIISGNIRSSKSKFMGMFQSRRKLFLLLCLVALVVLAIGILAWGYGHGILGRPNTQQQQQAQNQATIVPYQQRLQNEVAAAKQKVESDSNDPKIDKGQKVDDYLQLAISYQNDHMYSDAINAYQAALKIDPDSKRQVLNGLMIAYVLNNQRDKAIETGNERIAYLKSLKSDSSNEDPSIAQAIADTTAKIAKIKAGQAL